MSVFTIQTPDGRKIKIEAADEATAVRGAQEYVEANPPQQAPAAAPQPQAEPAPGVMDFASQALSGVNEGIANLAGAPVQITSDLINLGTTGVNKLTGSQIPQIENPVGGQQFFRDMLAPTIGEESDNQALQMTRRVSQEVGAMALPGMGAMAKAAKPVQLATRELAAALGSGGGAAVAEQVASGNPLA